MLPFVESVSGSILSIGDHLLIDHFLMVYAKRKIIRINQREQVQYKAVTIDLTVL